jgi:hypothetical protein
MERAWMLVSIIGLVTAAILLLRDYRDAAIVAGTLGAVAWFLSYRVKLRATIIEPDETTDIEDDDSENQDDE